MKTLSIRAIPNASRNEVVGEMADGALKVKLQAPPEGGRANQALIETLAKHFGIPKRRVHLLRGDKSRLKQVGIDPA